MSIELLNASYSYNADAKNIKYAVENVSLTIEKGEFIGLIGHTGSGKSTLIQLLNGLLLPTGGTVLFDGRDITEKGFSLKLLRQKVGMVFQYPEHQLFEETVFKDVCFGPKNLGLSKEEIEEKAKRAIEMAGLSPEYYEKSPFELSGGEKRRVAIAGILAMAPEYLVLDEPTAGLDPEGREEILSQVKKLQTEQGITVVLVSHSMEDVAKYADRLLVMQEGKLLFDDTPRAVFGNYKELEKTGLTAPQITRVCEALHEKGFPIRTDVLTVAEAKEEILKVIKLK